MLVDVSESTLDEKVGVSLTRDMLRVSLACPKRSKADLEVELGASIGLLTG